VPRGAVVIATATPRRTTPGVGSSSSASTSSVRHVFHRPPLQGATGRGLLTTRGGTVGGSSMLNGDLDALDSSSPFGRGADRRRASITVVTATPAELQHRSRMARDLMIVSFNLLTYSLTFILVCLHKLGL
jgi:hypothetical protein